MKVFKYYFKIAKARIPSIISYLFICLTAIILIVSVSRKEGNVFKASRHKLYVVDLDKSNLSTSYINYLKRTNKITIKKEYNASLRDDLFYMLVDGIIVIPKNFENDYLKKLDVKPEKYTLGSNDFYPTDNYIENNYFNVLNSYLQSGIDLNSSLKLIEDYKADDDTKLLLTNGNMKETAAVYFNMAFYSLIASLIIIINILSKSFFSDSLKRNLVSPLEQKKFNFIINLGHYVLGLLIMTIYFLPSFFFFPKVVLSKIGLLYFTNFVLFTLIITTLSIMISSLIKHNIAAGGGASTTISLFLAFISGLFVPQEFLPNGLLNFSKIFPVYWAAHLNNSISTFVKLESRELIIFRNDIFVMLLFFIIYFLILLLFPKKKLDE